MLHTTVHMYVSHTYTHSCTQLCTSMIYTITHIPVSHNYTLLCFRHVYTSMFHTSTHIPVAHIFTRLCCTQQQLILTRICTQSALLRISVIGGATEGGGGLQPSRKRSSPRYFTKQPEMQLEHLLRSATESVLLRTGAQALDQAGSSRRVAGVARIRCKGAGHHCLQRVQREVAFHSALGLGADGVVRKVYVYMISCSKIHSGNSDILHTFSHRLAARAGSV